MENIIGVVLIIIGAIWLIVVTRGIILILAAIIGYFVWDHQQTEEQALEIQRAKEKEKGYSFSRKKGFISNNNSVMERTQYI